jgi:ABC-type sugar transport system ATPase subunit
MAQDQVAAAARPAPDGEPLLRMAGITKLFPGVVALRDVSLEVFPGECLALVGENGAGKSTLMKILSGVYAPDAGEIFLNGEPVALSSPRQAQDLGISIIYQEFNLMPNLTVAENVFVGREPNAGGFVRVAEMERQTQALLDQLGVRLRPDAVVRDLSVAEQQMVEIAKALSSDARIVIMDEPTSALTDTEVAALVEIVGGLTARGLGVIFISHRLEEVFAMCDRVTVLRDGQNAGDVATSEASPAGIVRMMVGRNLSDLFQKDGADAPEAAPYVLEVRGLARAGSRYDASAIVLRDVSFGVRAGEIVGLAGLVGSGRTGGGPGRSSAPTRSTPARCWSRAARSPSAPPRRHPARPRAGAGGPQGAGAGARAGGARQHQPRLARPVRPGRLRPPRRGEAASRGFVRALRIRTPGLEQKVVNLSGGNQQKVVIAKWLALRPKVLIVDEPTAGIDIGAKAEVHHLMNDLARQGVAILMISSELPEILGMSDRVLVMRQGRIAGELGRAEATQEAIMGLATGVGREEQAA